MGWFDWLTGNKLVQTAPDRIWLSSEAKYEGIRNEVAQALADPAAASAILVVAHFNDCFAELQAAVADLDPGRVLVTRADALKAREPVNLVADESSSILIVVGERHPLAPHDKAVVDFARSQSGRCRVSYHLSLEDSVVRRLVAGPWVQTVLRGLGMKENEAIESGMVNRKIRSGLKKLARNAIRDEPAESAEEWFQRNCP